MVVHIFSKLVKVCTCVVGTVPRFRNHFATYAPMMGEGGSEVHFPIFFKNMPICRFTHFAHFSKFSNLCANVHFGEHHILLRISHKNLIWPHFPILADKFFSLISSYFLLFLKTIINFFSGDKKRNYADYRFCVFLRNLWIWRICRFIW